MMDMTCAETTMRNSPASFGLTEDPDAARYRKAATDFSQALAERKWLNQCTLAIEVGAKTFGVSIRQLRSKKRPMELVEARQKIMALAVHVIQRRGRFAAIGRAFKRDASSVKLAWHKFGRDVERALEE